MNDTNDSLIQDDNKLIAERRAKLAKRREAGNAFPNDFRRDSYAQDLQDTHGEKDKPELEILALPVKVAGRIIRNRGAFMEIQDVSGRIQLYVNRKGLAPEQLAEIKTWDLGDIVGVVGVLQKSGKGDLFVDMTDPQLLTKALRPLPDKHHGLADQEMRYRQRYVDLIVNEESRKTFIIRTRVVEAIRQYLIAREFMEVETPMMQVIPGGASARPFITHHNALDRDMYLRVAPELYLKRLVVGGFERVFEINRNFRNEGLSTRHNPEFTMLEFYWSYADFRDLMDLTEGMLRHIAESVLGNSKVTYQGSEYDFAQPFTRISVFDSILHYNPSITAQQLADEAGARAIAEGLGIPLKPYYGLGKVQIEIFEKR